jgi:hypothetical protein
VEHVCIWNYSIKLGRKWKKKRMIESQNIKIHYACAGGYNDMYGKLLNNGGMGRKNMESNRRG